ncbi:MAG: DUF6455 family protein [Pseudorhodobacter sp.]|nr:DUF6455 family protein [Pseudorhodobacter sp.]
MLGFIEAPRAWGLTQGMARVMGVSLPHAVVEGWLTRRDLATLVERCQSCGKSSDCTLWLARVAAADALPGFCHNKAEIESLAPLA